MEFRSFRSNEAKQRHRRARLQPLTSRAEITLDRGEALLEQAIVLCRPFLTVGFTLLAIELALSCIFTVLRAEREQNAEDADQCGDSSAVRRQEAAEPGRVRRVVFELVDLLLQLLTLEGFLAGE